MPIQLTLAQHIDNSNFVPMVPARSHYMPSLLQLPLPLLLLLLLLPIGCRASR